MAKKTLAARACFRFRFFDIILQITRIAITHCRLTLITWDPFDYFNRLPFTSDPGSAQFYEAAGLGVGATDDRRLYPGDSAFEAVREARSPLEA